MGIFSQTYKHQLNFQPMINTILAKVVDVIGGDLAPKFLGANEYTSGKGVVQLQSICP